MIQPAGEHSFSDLPPSALREVKSQWGRKDAQHYGYRSEEERLNKRGLEDWELVERIPLSQKPVPYWFLGVVVVVLLVGVGLAFPFWGVRPGNRHSWLDWGFAMALGYIAVAGYFIHFMVRMYGSALTGRLDTDPEQVGAERVNAASTASTVSLGGASSAVDTVQVPAPAAAGDYKPGVPHP